MDWFKLEAHQMLYEYEELNDREFRALIKVMCLSAILEHSPTGPQIKKEVHYRTLASLEKKLENKLKNMREIVENILKDVSKLNENKLKAALKKRQQRIDSCLETKNVPRDKNRDVPMDKNVPFREENREKRREEKKVNKKKETRSGLFQRPPLDEVKTFTLENKFIVDPDTFYDYYDSNGWKVGSNSMKNWKAALRRWNREELKRNGPIKEDWREAYKKHKKEGTLI